MSIQAIQARRLRWRLLKRMPGLIQGDFMSLARGSGFDLQHIQPYQDGDDIRRIDWHASARSHELQMRQMHEDRDFHAWLVVDLSASSTSGLEVRSKRDQLLALSACIIESVAQHGNRIGLWIEDGRNQAALRVTPQNGRAHRLRILHAIEQHQAPAQNPDIYSDLDRLFKQIRTSLRRRALVILVSDFIDHSQRDQDQWSESLRLLNRRHDVIAIKLEDSSEWVLPDRGYFLAEDAETGEQLWIDAEDQGFRARYEEAVKLEQALVRNRILSSGSRLMRIDHRDHALLALSRWLQAQRFRKARP